jgi:hypothetical protein
MGFVYRKLQVKPNVLLLVGQHYICGKGLSLGYIHHTHHIGRRVSFPGIKRPWHSLDYTPLPPASAKAKEEWSYITTLC